MQQCYGECFNASFTLPDVRKLECKAIANLFTKNSSLDNPVARAFTKI